MIRRAGLLLSWLLAAAAPLRAQDPRLAARLDPAALRSVQPLVDSARALGLPAEPLVSKALEGAAKRASAERIAAAVRALLADLRTARVALGPGADGPAVAAGASALRAGIRPEDLHRLRDAGGGAAVPLAVLAELVARGVPADTAVEAVLELARHGVAEPEYTRFERHVVQDIGAGIPPGVAAATRAAAPAALGPPAGVTRGAPPAGRPRPAPPAHP